MVDITKDQRYEDICGFWFFEIDASEGPRAVKFILDEMDGKGGFKNIKTTWDFWIPKDDIITRQSVILKAHEIIKEYRLKPSDEFVKCEVCNTRFWKGEAAIHWVKWAYRATDTEAHLEDRYLCLVCAKHGVENAKKKVQKNAEDSTAKKEPKTKKAKKGPVIVTGLFDAASEAFKAHSDKVAESDRNESE